MHHHSYLKGRGHASMKVIMISKHNLFCTYKMKNWFKYSPPNLALANSDQELWSSSCDLHLTESYYFKCHLNITKCLLIPTANSLYSLHLPALLSMALDSYSLLGELQSTLLLRKATNVKLSLTFGLLIEKSAGFSSLKVIQKLFFGILALTFQDISIIIPWSFL